MCPSGRYSKSENAGDSNFQQISAGISDVRPVFAVLDADGDGKIGIDDLRSFYADISGEVTNEDDIGTMISVADSDNSGFVEFEEFERVLGFSGDLKTTPENRVLKEAFSVMDKDGDGFVGFSDLKSYMSWAGFPANDEDLKMMIEMGGGDETKGVCYDGLLKILTVDVAGDFLK